MKAAVAITAASAVAANAIATPASKQVTKRQSGNLPAVSVKGNAFFAGDERFYIKGIDYQPGGSSDAADPLSDVSICKRDIAQFQKLGINTVRIYTIDNAANHDECMSLLDQAGIYLALDVNTPDYSINRADPAASYNDAYLQSVFSTIDAFAKYDNTLLFFSGNEVINADNNTNCAPYVKATTRDMKSYIASQGYRQIPVGYSAADVESNRYDMAAYMNCGTPDQRSDFFAFNDYSWCDPSSYTISGWDQKVAKFKDYSIPLFLSEYGCITNARKWQEVSSLYGPQMTPVYSGGLVYEYTEEGSGYGLVNINGNSVSETPDFTALAAAFKKVSVSGDGDYKSSGQPSTCPRRSKTWEVTDFEGEELPSMPEKAVSYMKSGAGKPPGLNGPGSQNAGGTSTGTASAGSGAMPTQSGESFGISHVRPDSTLKPLLACGAAIFFSTLFGATLL